MTRPSTLTALCTVLIALKLVLADTPLPTFEPTAEPTRIPPEICAEIADSCHNFILLCDDLRARCPISSDCYATYVSTCEQNIADCEYVLSLCYNETFAPTAEPTSEPTAIPTSEPSREPTSVPTAEPTQQPTVLPTLEPTPQPTFICDTYTFAPLSPPGKNTTACRNMYTQCSQVVIPESLVECAHTCDGLCQAQATKASIRQSCAGAYARLCFASS